MAALAEALARSYAVRLHFAELQGASRSLRPFRLHVLREIASPKYSGFLYWLVRSRRNARLNIHAHETGPASCAVRKILVAPAGDSSRQTPSVEPLGESPRFKPGGICSKTSQPRVGGQSRRVHTRRIGLMTDVNPHTVEASVTARGRILAAAAIRRPQQTLDRIRQI